MSEELVMTEGVAYFVLFVSAVIGLVMLFAQVKLFSIAKSLEEIVYFLYEANPEVAKASMQRQSSVSGWTGDKDTARHHLDAKGRLIPPPDSSSQEAEDPSAVPAAGPYRGVANGKAGPHGIPPSKPQP